jgi:GNAT superfamily N-acetyltransferase
MSLRVRPATADDVRFVEDMLVEAAAWDPHRPTPPRDDVLAAPENAHYVAGWPRPTDAGVVAEDDDGEPVGAAWYRFFDEDDPGYGFVDPSIPEVAIGVVPSQRSQGIGTLLLDHLHAVARDQGIAALSLSVETANPAYLLYARLGYQPVGNQPGPAAQAAGSVTMRFDVRRAG